MIKSIVYSLQSCKQANHYLIKIITKRFLSFLCFPREIEACHQLLGALKASFKQLISLHLSSEEGNLFPTKEFTITDVFNQASEINQTAFYGRCFGFQFYDSIRNTLKFISIIMASYSESYYSNNGKFVKTSNSIYNSGRYYFDPEMLASRLVDLSQNASVDFCKVHSFY